MGNMEFDFAAFDAIADSAAIGDDGNELIRGPKTGVKRSVRLERPAIADSPANADRAADSPVIYQREAPIGDRGSKRISKRLLSGATAHAAVSALTGYAPAKRPAADRPAGKPSGSKRAKRLAKRAAAAIDNRTPNRIAADMAELNGVHS